MRFRLVTSCFILKYNSLLLSGHLPFPNVSPAWLSFLSCDSFHLFLIALLCVYKMCVSLCPGPECCVPPCTKAIVWNTQISLFKLPLSGSFSLIESDFFGGFFFHLEWCFDNSQFVASLFFPLWMNDFVQKSRPLLWIILCISVPAWQWMFGDTEESPTPEQESDTQNNASAASLVHARV